MKALFTISAEGRTRTTNDANDVASFVNMFACEYLGEDSYQMPNFTEMTPGDFILVEFEEDETFSVNVSCSEIELTKIDLIAEALREANINVTVASTGSVYVKTPRSDEFAQIRIADHDANGKHGNFEIDANKVDFIDSFVEAVKWAVQFDDFSDLEEYLYF